VIRSAEIRQSNKIAPEATRIAPGAVRRLWRWLDSTSSPQPDTHGDFAGPAYVPAAVVGLLQGFALSGVAGGITSCSAGLAGVLLEGKTGSNWLGVAAGVGVGAAVAAITFPGGTLLTKAITGALLGAFQVYRGNQHADVRGAGTFGAMLAAIMIQGPLKVAAGIASAAAEHMASDNPLKKAAVGAAIGAALGLALCASGMLPLNLLTSALVSGGAGAIGPVVGPRYTQMFRNLSKSFGGAFEAGLGKIGVVNSPMPWKLRNCLGALPSSVLKEGLNGYIYSDGRLSGLIAGSVMDATQQVAVFIYSRTRSARSTSACASASPTSASSTSASASQQETPVQSDSHEPVQSDAAR